MTRDAFGDIPVFTGPRCPITPEYEKYNMKFTELGLAEPIVRAVSDLGYSTPSPIQAVAIPEALTGRDVLGCAQTGTGKTCAFALPILHRLSDSRKTRSHKGRNGVRTPRAIVLCPTRELASQIFDSFVSYGRNLHLRHAVVFGGVPQRNQVRALRAGVDVLVATPGRLHDLINQGHIDLRQIEVLVLDEADRMLDMGFIHDIRKVVGMIPEDRQTLFFSATVSKEIRRLADSMLDDPARVETAPESSTVDAIAQRAYCVDRANKPELLGRLLNQKEVNRALVFTRTKYGADKLVKILRREKINAEAIHGDKSQNARTRAMGRFKSGATRVLVATDIASRGIDVDEITHVFNFDMPIDVETYVHRIGRTARAGATGIAIAFCDRDEIRMLRSIERRAKIQIEVGEGHEDLTFEAPATPRRAPGKKFHAPRKSGGSKPRRSNDRTQDDRPNTAGSNGQGRKKSKKTGYPRNPDTSSGAPRSKKPRKSRKPNASGQAGKPAPGGRKPGAGAKRVKKTIPW